MRVDLGHAELAGIVDVGQQDLRRGKVLVRRVELELAAALGDDTPTLELDIAPE